MTVVEPRSATSHSTPSASRVTNARARSDWATLAANASRVTSVGPTVQLGHANHWGRFA